MRLTSLIDIASRTETALSGLQGETEAAAARITTVQGAVIAELSPLAGACAAATALRSEAERIVHAHATLLCLHPWMHPVGDRRGDYAYLTPRAAMDALGAKFADPEFTWPGRMTAVVVLVAATDLDSFTSVLETFNAIWPVTPLMLVQRRAERLGSLETDKLVQAVGPLSPNTTARSPRHHTGGSTIGTTLGALLGVADGHAAESVDLAEELTALLQAKAALISKQEEAWAEMVARLDDLAPTRTYILEGDAVTIRRQLLTASVPGAENKLSVVACWVGDVAQMTFFAEIFL